MFLGVGMFFLIFKNYLEFILKGLIIWRLILDEIGGF